MLNILGRNVERPLPKVNAPNTPFFFGAAGFPPYGVIRDIALGFEMGAPLVEKADVDESLDPGPAEPTAAMWPSSPSESTVGMVGMSGLAGSDGFR